MAAFPLSHRPVRLVTALALALVLLPVPGTVARGPDGGDPPGTSDSRPDAAKPFRLNLARRSDYVAQANFVQCVGASVQMMLNIIEPGADRTRRTQRELQALARTWSGPRPDGRVRQGAGVSGWATALTINRAGPYRVVGATTLDEAMRVAATAIRLHRKPVGLLVWQGRHAWVMSGFEATGDPVDGTFRVTRAYILDPLYPHGSDEWGPSPKPGTLIPVSRVGEQFVRRRSLASGSPWNRLPGMARLAGKYVLVVPSGLIRPGLD
jgi:hypothetical protein